MIPPIFIEARRLGSAVEASVRQMLIETDKRKRATKAKRMINLLRFLTLVPPPGALKDAYPIPPTGIALGIRSDGELGLWLIYEPAIKIQGDIAT